MFAPQVQTVPVSPSVLPAQTIPVPAPVSQPIVGGRLKGFKAYWRDTLRASKWCLQAVEGYHLPMTSTPRLSTPRPSQVFSPVFSDEEAAVIREEVQSLLAKAAVRPADPSSPGQVTHLFVVPKKDGGMRPIINLKPFNKTFLDPPHFKMEGPKDVIRLLRPGDWAASIDLKDAYFHVPIFREHCKMLRFFWDGILYEFLVLPFGLATAPYVFTKLSKPVVAFLRRMGIRLIIYLDDLLVIGASELECAANVEKTLKVLRDAGFVVNLKKSRLQPSQSFQYLGLVWDSVACQISLPPVRHQVILDQAFKCLQSVSPSCASLLRLLGLMSAAILAVPLIRLKSRFLQRAVIAVYRSDEDADLPVPLSGVPLQDLLWVSQLLLTDCVAPLWPPRLDHADLRVASDASDEGWGLYFAGQMERARWAPADALLHINVKELMVLLIFLREFYSRCNLRIKTIRWEVDNTSALAYVKKQGGTSSLPLLQVASEVLLLASHLGVTILPVYIPSEQNLHADFASRFRDLPDLHLLPSVFRKMCSKWGTPEIDLFASPASRQLPRFYAWDAATTAEHFDALSRPWHFKMAYLFPPIPLIPRVIDKLFQSSGAFFLVTPFWPNQTWFPLLRLLPVVDVRRLPLSPTLIVDLQTGEPPLNLLDLRLVVWLLSDVSMVSRTSERTPSTSFLQPGETAPMIGTNVHGSSLRSSFWPTDFLLIPLL